MGGWSPDEADTAPRQGGPGPRDGLSVSQYGLVEVALSRSYLAGVVVGPLRRFAERWAMPLEQSSAQGGGCEVLYCETNEDAFTLVQWAEDPAGNVEVWAHVAPHCEQSTRLAQPEFRRFLALAHVTPDDVVFGLEPLDDVPAPDEPPPATSGKGLFSDYQEDAWPSREQVADLPGSLTGLGLDQPLSAVRAATELMTRTSLQDVRRRFCHGWPGDDDHICECTAMDAEGPEDDIDWRRVDAHVTAESVAEDRLFAVWVLMQHGPAAMLEGVAVTDYLTRFAEYDA